MTLDMFPETQLAPEEEPDERYTPRALFDPLHAKYRFDLDVCATAESAKCERYFTAAEDGLSQSWDRARVWCNPPYSDIEPWVKKAWSSDADLVAMLLPAWTDREWWAKHVEPYRDGRVVAVRLAGEPVKPVVRLTTRFLPGRVRFGFKGNPEGVGQDSPPFWCVLLVWERP